MVDEFRFRDYLRVMKERLIVELAQLPEEGMAISGDIDRKIFELPEGDAVPMGELEYDLYVQRFDDEVLFRGYVGAPFEFVCVRTNKKFIQTISLEEIAVSIEANGGSVDASEAIREEVLINLPDYPKCDQADDPQECKLDEQYLALDKPPVDDVNEPSPSESDDRWSALDGFNQFKDNN